MASIVLPEYLPPETLEHVGLDPVLEAAVAGGTRAELFGQGFPLAAGPQDVENAIHHGAEGNDRPAIGPWGFLGRQERLDSGPEIVGDAPDSAETSLRRHG